MYEIYYASRRERGGETLEDALRFARWKISGTRRGESRRDKIFITVEWNSARSGDPSIHAPLPGYNSENNLVSYRPRLSQLHFGNLYSIIPFQPGMRSRPDLARLQRFKLNDYSRGTPPCRRCRYVCFHLADPMPEESTVCTLRGRSITSPVTLRAHLYLNFANYKSNGSFTSHWSADRRHGVTLPVTSKCLLKFRVL